MKRGGNASRPSTPVESGYGESFQLQSIGEIDHILTDRCLLGHPGRGRIAKTRGAESSQIGHENAITSFHQRRRHVVPRMNVIRKTMEENDWHSSRISTVSIRDTENRRLDRFCVAR